jgi:peroxiredoxin/outer membrane lipoprotein-sorting protein
MVIRLCLLFGFIVPLFAQNSTADVTRVVKEISEKAKNATSYAFEGELLIQGKRGEVARTLSQAKVKLAVAPQGKFLLRVAGVDKDEYWLQSDGQKTWAYVPKLKKYTETESAQIVEDDEEESGGGGSDERDMAEKWSRLIVPTLAKMYETAKAADQNGTVDVKYEGEKQKWPLYRVITKKDAIEGQSLTQVAVDPNTLRIGRIVWSTAFEDQGEKMVFQLTLNVSSMQLGTILPEATFVFDPPKNAKLADSVPIPGQTGSFLVDKPAPDFELKTLEGEKVKLSDFRGKPVLLNFWATWCGPCRREMPGLVKLYQENRGKGLVVLGLNDEDRGTARKFCEANNVQFATLDDSALKAHRLYRVRSIPSIFLIDKDGKVVKFFSGAQDYSKLQTALKAVGL